MTHKVASERFPKFVYCYDSQNERSSFVIVPRFHIYSKCSQFVQKWTALPLPPLLAPQALVRDVLLV